MEKDYAWILETYPEFITLEQLRKICHISKRKGQWLLVNGVIPCQDNHKPTHRFKIRTTDVIHYLKCLDTNPLEVQTPVGLFTSHSKNKDRQKLERYHRSNTIASINQEQFSKYLEKEWEMYPDILLIGDIPPLIGYRTQTIASWVTKKQLRSMKVAAKRVVPKSWLIAFTCSHVVRRTSHISPTLMEMVNNFRTKDSFIHT